MPRHQATVLSPWSADRVYDYLADLEHFAEWDPGTVRAERVRTDPSTPRSYDVTVSTFGRELTLRYAVLEAAPPRHLLLHAETGTLRLTDEITIDRQIDGCVVTYAAELTLRGPLRLFEPLLAPGFRRTVDRGAAGLTTVLEGVAA